MPLENLSRHEISEHLNQQGIVAQDIAIIVADCLHSTNDYLLSLVNNSAVIIPTTVLLAEIQTGGKGRDGRSWISPPGNIYMSLYWPYKCKHEKLQGLSLVVGIAIARVIKANGVLDVQLKWPNDIFWHGQKMGGILIETKQNRLGIIDCVVGIGLNVIDMQPYRDRIDQKAVGLQSILNQEISRNKLIAQIIAELYTVLTHFASYGFAAFTEEWHALDCKNECAIS